MVRTACCRISEMPQVASSVSSGRPYSHWITVRSIRMPIAPETRKASGMAMASE